MVKTVLRLARESEGRALRFVELISAARPRSRTILRRRLSSWQLLAFLVFSMSRSAGRQRGSNSHGPLFEILVATRRGVEPITRLQELDPPRPAPRPAEFPCLRTQPCAWSGLTFFPEWRDSLAVLVSEARWVTLSDGISTADASRICCRCDQSQCWRLLDELRRELACG